MLENPDLLEKLVKETGAHSTDLQSPESVEHLCGKCKEYAEKWKEPAAESWEEQTHKIPYYQNYKSVNRLETDGTAKADSTAAGDHTGDEKADEE